MKKTGAIFCLALMFIMLSTSFSFAGDGALKLEDTYPRDKDTGTAVENLSVKLYFDQDVLPKDAGIRAKNQKAFKMVDDKGKTVPIQVLYSHKEKGMMMILSKSSGSKSTIKGNTEYTLTIDPAFQGTGGDNLDSAKKVSFTTLDQSKSMTINMVMMGVMMVGMVFFSSKSMKRQQEKEKAAKGKVDTVNPYKEAKRTGKSVEEIVERDRKNKEKQAAAQAKKKAKEKKEEEDSNKNRITADNKRVSGPKPIAEGGGKYKSGRKAAAEAKKAKSTTRPKNQTGKQRNTKKK